MAARIVTTPFDDQKPGTSGLRKRVTQFQQPHYLENFVQSIFDSLEGIEGQTLVLGGDGRFYNVEACKTILRMAVAAGFGRVIVGKSGLLSTPAVSHLIRKRAAFGGIILSASHNPGGPNGDFGIKYNASNGGPAKEQLTDAIYARSLVIDHYMISESSVPDLAEVGDYLFDGMVVEVVDPVTEYADLMETLFDFDAIRAMFLDGFSFRFDAMHAVTGPYAHEIFSNQLGLSDCWILNGQPDPSFGGGHPDPNTVHAKEICNLAMMPDGPDLSAASDGDGDRNMIVGKGILVSPSDSLAVIAANAHLTPAHRNGLKGVARSMPTSGAVDRVAKVLGIPCFETPTGWKFFGNLLDSGDISLCGEESAGTGADHVREKDGVWAVLMWLNILAVRNISVIELLEDHWHSYGRNYYSRFDYEEVDANNATRVMDHVRENLSSLSGQETLAGPIKTADEFSYTDPVDGSVSNGQGLRILFEDGSRIVFRLSGTGTVGATIRIYIERFEAVDGDLKMETSKALSQLFSVAMDISKLTELTGRVEADVVT